MGSRKDILKNLGIPEYPWSSDDDESPTDQRPPPNSNSLQPAAQQPSSSLAGPSGHPGRNNQSRELFMSLLSSVPRNGPAGNGNSGNGNSSNERPTYRPHNDITYLTRATHTPAPELRGRATDRADLDIQRVLAFKRLTRTVNNGHRNSRYWPRGPSRPGAVVPSESNSSCVRLPYYRRVNRGVPTNNIPGSARQIIVDHPQARPPSAVHPRRRTYSMEVQNSDAESEEPLPSTSNSPPPVPAPATAAPDAPAPAPASADSGPLSPPSPSYMHDEEEPLERGDDEPDAEELPNDSLNASHGSGSGVALVEEIVEIVDDPATGDMGLSDRARAVMPSSNDPNLASTSRSDEADGAELEQQNHGVKRKRRDSTDDKSTDSSTSTVQQFNQSLLRLLECPVCLEWMEPPMSQCRRGHLVCNRCRARLASCPVCRTTFSSVRNRAMEGVAEMLRYPCRHGCGREVRLRKRAPHEASCAARKYLCPAPLCADRMPLPRNRLADHFQSRHLHLVKLGARHQFGIKVNSEAHENWIIMALDEFFHMKVDVDIRTWGVIVYVAYIGPKCNAMDFAYEVSIDGQHSTRKMWYKRATHSDLDSSSLNVSRQDCFHLTLDQALNFIRFKNRHCDAEKFLEFNVEITRIEPPPSRDDSDS